MKLTEIIQELVKSLANRGDLEISAIVVKTSQNEVILEIPGIPETADETIDETDSDFVNYPDTAPSAAEAALSDYRKKFRDYLSDSISDAKELLQAEKEPQNNPTQPPPSGSGFVDSTDNDMHQYYRDYFARLEANSEENLSKSQDNAGYHKIEAKVVVKTVTSDGSGQKHYLYEKPVELGTERTTPYPVSSDTIVTAIIVFLEEGYIRSFQIPKNGRFELSAL